MICSASNFSQKELEEAKRSIASTLSKSEKALLKLKEGSFWRTSTVEAIKTYYIALDFIEKELEAEAMKDTLDSRYTKDELEKAIETIASLTGKVEKMLPKFEVGSPQHTLAARRIQAFNIATELIGKCCLDK